MVGRHRIMTGSMSMKRLRIEWAEARQSATASAYIGSILFMASSRRARDLRRRNGGRKSSKS